MASKSVQYRNRRGRVSNQ